LKRDDVDRKKVTEELASGKLKGTQIHVRLYDFGGQDVFYSIHPYFLTRTGIYLVVFNMSHLRPKQTEENDAHSQQRQNKCLQYLSFWLNSVAVNTKHIVNAKEVIAPIVLVGTHKDLVLEERDHHRISRLLTRKFSHSIFWPFVAENTTNGLVYFPVKNVAGEGDPTIDSLMETVITKVKLSPHLSVMRPLCWFRIIDILTAREVATITFKEVCDVAAECGIQLSSVPTLLEFLHDMGVLMWFREGNLEDTIILDPIAYFVTPVTRIICDPGLHGGDIHKACWKQYRGAYDNLRQNRLANRKVLQFLLSGSDCSDKHSETLIELMLRFKLLVRWESMITSPSAVDTDELFIVPSLFLLSDNAVSCMELKYPLPPECPVITVYLLFALDEKTLTFALEEKHFWNNCFLPTGVFEHLGALALSWSQLTPDADPEDLTLNKDLIILAFGNVWFRMVHRPVYNCIQVDAAAPAMLTVLRRLMGLLKTITISATQHLHVMPFVSFADNSGEQKCFLGESCLTGIVEGSTSKFELPWRQSLDKDLIRSEHPWLTAGRCSVDPCRYDGFISYRWNRSFEDTFVTSLYDQLSDFVIEDRVLQVFLDRKRIPVARPFPTVFFGALMNSHLMIPVVSPYALQRMLAHRVDCTTIDFLLTEWLSAMVINRYSGHYPDVKLKYVYPIIVVEPVDGAEISYFSMKEHLSTEIPVPTIKEVKHLFAQSCGALPLEALNWIDEQTVKSIVDGIMTHNNPRQISLKASMKKNLTGSVKDILDILCLTNTCTLGSRSLGKNPFRRNVVQSFPEATESENITF
jgi:GTPase SAR1 family protein